MGILASRHGTVAEDVDSSNINPLMYRYPPKQGNFFSNYFIMGGERFEAQQPETYLFGDNSDLNFLGNRPIPFPYSAPQTNEPTKTLRALVNVRKESVRFIRTTTTLNSGVEETAYSIEFVFDSDVSCSVTVYFGCSEESMSRGVRYVSRSGSQPETFYYKPGAAQMFNQPTVLWCPCDIQSHLHVQTNLYPSGQLMTRVADVTPGTEGEIIPVVIVCQAEEGDDPKQHQATYCLIEHSSDSSYVLKALKQKLYVDNLAYLLQDIYGIENKLVHTRETDEQDTEIEEEEGSVVLDDCEPEDDEEGGGECVICMSEPRDTLILPCRHLCLCQLCADSLRYQANNCPICRSPFRALLQIRALRKLQAPSPAEFTHMDECVPLGYEAISLLEALNGLAVAPRRPKQRRAISTNDCNQSEAVNCTQQNGETVITVTDEHAESTAMEHVENCANNEETNAESFTEIIPTDQILTSPINIIGNRLGWNRMQNGRRSLGAVAGDTSSIGSPPVPQGLRRTRSAHTRRPLINPSSSLLGTRGATSPSLRSSGDSCSSADSTRRLVKPPAHLPVLDSS